MKKCMLLLLLVVAFSSCKKDGQTLTENGLKFTPKTLELIELVKDGKYADNAGDAERSRQSLAIILSSRDCFKHNTFTKAVLDKIKPTASKTFKLSEFYSSNKEFKGALDNNLSIYSELLEIPEEAAKSSAILSAMSIQDIDHYHSFYVLNAEWMDETKDPIITSNDYINLDDEILGWKLNVNGDWDEVLITETSIQEIDNPVIGMDLTVVQDEQKLAEHIAFEEEYNRTHTPNTKAMRAIHSHRLRLSHNLEHGTDEVWITAGGIDNNNQQHLFLYKNGGLVNRVSLRNVQDLDMGKDLYNWFNIYDNTNNPSYLTTSLFYNLFEYDWNRSLRFMGKGERSANLNTVYLRGRTKDANGWYIYTPGTEEDNTWISEVPTTQIQSTWLWTSSSSRALLDWWRID
jgi:hypothetical protein